MRAILLLCLLFLCGAEGAWGAGFDQLAPVSQCDQLLKKTYYWSCYSADYRQARWTYHQLTRAQIEGPQGRTNRFQVDEELQFAPVDPRDYTGTGYDRGHLVPAGDMKLNLRSMTESFLMSNVSPQLPGFNRGIWVRLENSFRKWVLELEAGFVVTAPVLTPELPRLAAGIAIPQAFYKIIYLPQESRMRAYLIPNASLPAKGLEHYRATVNSIEDLTGIDFFAGLEDGLEERLESQ